MTVTENAAEHRFEIRVDGEVAGFSQYRREDGTLTVTHTEVDDAYEGRGVGSELVRGVLDAARAEGVRVVPLCPFVRAYIERHQEYADLVA